MDFNACAQCGVQIEGKGIRFRGRSFCGDECCDEFEASLPEDVEPDPDELAADDFDDDDLDDEVAFAVGDDDVFDEEDFTISPDDF